MVSLPKVVLFHVSGLFIAAYLAQVALFMDKGHHDKVVSWNGQVNRAGPRVDALTAKDLATLLPGNAVNDNVINAVQH
jgi:hypothetical protein